MKTRTVASDWVSYGTTLDGAYLGNTFKPLVSVKTSAYTMEIKWKVLVIFTVLLLFSATEMFLSSKEYQLYYIDSSAYAEYCISVKKNKIKLNTEPFTKS